jgi:hypothetical protein
MKRGVEAVINKEMGLLKASEIFSFLGTWNTPNYFSMNLIAGGQNLDHIPHTW